jgi:GT2 family glycosyltransferase
MPCITAVVISRNEADRLRLTLTALAADLRHGDLDAEVIVVDDGSTDHTPAVLRDAAASIVGLRLIRHAESRGRSPSRNAGARAAAAPLVLFLDGDVLVRRGSLHAHLEAHRRGGVLARGETFHLRCTRFFLDPEAGTPMPGHEDRLARMSAAELDAMRVTRAQIVDRFAAIESRAEPGLYPGAAPRRLYELEMRALSAAADVSVLWMAVSAQNLSVEREPFLAANGFDEEIDLNEHRELAYRLCRRGLRVVPAPGARTYHLTHRVGWRDPLADDVRWERQFLARHSDPAVRLMSVFWLSLTGDRDLPETLKIHSLEQLDTVCRGADLRAYDELRRTHPVLRRLESG